MQSFVPRYIPLVVVLPLFLSLLPRGSFQLFPGVSLSWGKAAADGENLSSVNRDLREQTSCSGDFNLNSIFKIIIFILCYPVNNLLFA